MIGKQAPALEEGYVFPSLCSLPITRTTLALYSGSSGDHNPIHIDIDFARNAGLPDVIAQGMLSMAVLGQAIDAWVGKERLRSFKVRFTAVTRVADKLRCSARVARITRDGSEPHACLGLIVSTRDDRITLQGEATISLT